MVDFKIGKQLVQIARDKGVRFEIRANGRVLYHYSCLRVPKSLIAAIEEDSASVNAILVWEHDQLGSQVSVERMIDEVEQGTYAA